jgi:uncharacterized protein (TIGR00251 family)
LNPFPVELFPERGGHGVTLRLRVSAGAKRSRIIGPHGGALKLSVKAPPEKGRANEEVVALVARRFGLTLSQVELLRGATSQDKLIRLALAPEEAARRWAECAERPAIG